MSFFDLKGFLIGCGVVVFILVLNGGDLIPKQSTHPFDKALERADTCLGKGDDTVCAVTVARDLVSLKSGSEIMDAFAERLNPGQCHYAGHFVGKELYKKYGNVEDAIATCNRECDSSCPHGIIGEAFATGLGYDDPDFDLKHLSPEEIRIVGGPLCKVATNCHGVGHALFQAYLQLEPSLEMCREIVGQPLKLNCYQGAVMEYADILSERNTRSISGLTYPTSESLSAFCDLPLFEERRACFRYFTRVAEETLKKEGVSRSDAIRRVRDICAAQKTWDDKMACVAGVGVYSAYWIRQDQTMARRFCGQFAVAEDRAACYLGQISVATQDRLDTLPGYCKSQTEERFRESCYQTMFFFLLRLGTPVEEVRAICAQEDKACTQAFEHRARDPWREIARIF